MDATFHVNFISSALSSKILVSVASISDIPKDKLFLELGACVKKISNPQKYCYFCHITSTKMVKNEKNMLRVNMEKVMERCRISEYHKSANITDEVETARL